VNLANIKLLYPADNNKTMVTQLFGVNPAVYSQFGYPGHNGIDIASYGGVKIPIAAVASGLVTKVGFDAKGYGNYVIIEHGGYSTLYAHFDKVNVAQNKIVEAGDVLGKMGTTGFSTGVHLHFELRVPGHGAPGYKQGQLNPLPFFVAFQVPPETEPPPMAELEIGKHAKLADGYLYVNLRPVPEALPTTPDLGDLTPGIKLPIMELRSDWALLGVWVSRKYLQPAD